jgi:hypothetical protein
MRAGRVRVSALTTPTPTPSQVPCPHLDNELREGLRDDLEKIRSIAATTDVEGGNHESSNVVQVAGGSLQGQQNQNGQPVKAVVHCGPCESPGQGGHIAGWPRARVCSHWGFLVYGAAFPPANKPPPSYPSSPPEVSPVPCLHQGHNGVGDRGSDVGAHDDGYGRAHFQHWWKRSPN